MDNKDDQNVEHEVLLLYGTLSNPKISVTELKVCAVKLLNFLNNNVNMTQPMFDVFIKSIICVLRNDTMYTYKRNVNNIQNSFASKFVISSDPNISNAISLILQKNKEINIDSVTQQDISVFVRNKLFNILIALGKERSFNLDKTLCIFNVFFDNIYNGHDDTNKFIENILEFCTINNDIVEELIKRDTEMNDEHVGKIILMLINKKIKMTQKCLHYITEVGNIELVKVALLSGTRLDEECLIIACENFYEEIVKYILENKIMPTHKCFMAVINNTYVNYNRSRRRNYQKQLTDRHNISANIIDLLVKHGYKLTYNDVCDATKKTIKINNIEQTGVKLDSKFVDLCIGMSFYPYNTTGIKPSSGCLEKECEKSGNLKNITKLLKDGMEPTQKCLYNACKKKNNIQVIKLLISKGLKPDIFCIKNMANDIGNRSLVHLIDEYVYNNKLMDIYDNNDSDSDSDSDNSKKKITKNPTKVKFCDSDSDYDSDSNSNKKVNKSNNKLDSDIDTDSDSDSNKKVNKPNNKLDSDIDIDSDSVKKVNKSNNKLDSDSDSDTDSVKKVNGSNNKLDSDSDSVKKVNGSNNKLDSDTDSVKKVNGSNNKLDSDSDSIKKVNKSNNELKKKNESNIIKNDKENKIINKNTNNLMPIKKNNYSKSKNSSSDESENSSSDESENSSSDESENSSSDESENSSSDESKNSSSDESKNSSSDESKNSSSDESKNSSSDESENITNRKNNNVKTIVSKQKKPLNNVKTKKPILTSSESSEEMVDFSEENSTKSSPVKKVLPVKSTIKNNTKDNTKNNEKTNTENNLKKKSVEPIVKQNIKENKVSYVNTPNNFNIRNLIVLSDKLNKLFNLKTNKTMNFIEIRKLFMKYAIDNNLIVNNFITINNDINDIIKKEPKFTVDLTNFDNLVYNLIKDCKIIELSENNNAQDNNTRDNTVQDTNENKPKKVKTNKK